MKKDRPEPPGGVCPKRPKNPYTSLLPTHQWNYSSSWNGNNPDKFPMFAGITRGIARSGYRCLHCGAFAWDEPDHEWALKIGMALGLIKIRVRVPARCEVVK